MSYLPAAAGSVVFALRGTYPADGDRTSARMSRGHGFAPGSGYVAPAGDVPSAQFAEDHVAPLGDTVAVVLPLGYGWVSGSGYIAPSAEEVSASFASWGAYSIPSPPVTIGLPPDGRVFGAALGVMALGGAVVVRNGVRASASGAVPLSGEAVSETENTGRVANALGVLSLGGALVARHGVRSAALGTLPITLAGASLARHGVRAATAGAIRFVGAAHSRHGVRATPVGAVPLRGVVGTTHGRYEVRGEVRLSPGGALAQRLVRVYARDSGELVASGDTVGGYFHLHCGFAPGEYVVLPIDMSPAAMDFVPPVANRVLSVLAQDAWR